MYIYIYICTRIAIYDIKLYYTIFNTMFLNTILNTIFKIYYTIFIYNIKYGIQIVLEHGLHKEQVGAVEGQGLLAAGQLLQEIAP